MSKNDISIADIGGQPAGPVDTGAHDPTMTERRIDAMMMVLRAKPQPLWITDENRRTIESLTPEFYENSAYYEKWVTAMRLLLVEKCVMTEAEIKTKIQEVRARFAQESK